MKLTRKQFFLLNISLKDDKNLTSINNNYFLGSSVCDGDSGGGLVFKDKELWFLRGIVSVGIGAQGDNGERTCNSYTYSLYTEVASGNLDWIQDVIQNLRSNKFYPQCHVEEIKFFES